MALHVSWIRKPMTEEQQALAKQDMRMYLELNPGTNLTELAEFAANEQSHDEWLDDPDHKIWDIAFTISEEHE